MLFIYRILINLAYVASPLIILLRIIKKKEHLIRFKEKIGFFKKKKFNGELIWFHGASVGELQSVIPLLEKFEKNKKIKQILITSNTLSSSKIINKLRLKKTIHQFFPIDTNFISKKFINYWKPSKAFFIDSEIWPNTILQLKKHKIPSILINGRITKKTFKRWRFFSGFSKKIFSNFNLCLAASNQSLVFLNKLGAKNVKLIGNLKFSQSEKEIPKINRKLKNFIDKKTTWCASSTHQSEEIACGMAHLELKKKFKNLLTIIIPRHIERSAQIKKDLEKLNLKVHIDESSQKMISNTDIYLVNSFGKTKIFFSNTKNVFLGGSLIKHGGQNPLEAARLGCNILNGPFVHNFTEVYDFLEKNKISQKILSQKGLVKKLYILLRKKNKTNKIEKKLEIIGQNILEKSYKEINSNYL
ncbi:3-deoxy-D-manno-octulosonic acid transferase [Candidatus Pelagibacter sp.]|nr:3-deoxy-D-manno-octulosonic acid transferase [Candidatus Pelagibacter sp.]